MLDLHPTQDCGGKCGSMGSPGFNSSHHFLGNSTGKNAKLAILGCPRKLVKTWLQPIIYPVYRSEMPRTEGPSWFLGQQTKRRSPRNSGGMLYVHHLKYMLDAWNHHSKAPRPLGDMNIANLSQPWKGKWTSSKLLSFWCTPRKPTWNPTTRWFELMFSFSERGHFHLFQPFVFRAL